MVLLWQNKKAKLKNLCVRIILKSAVNFLCDRASFIACTCLFRLFEWHTLGNVRQQRGDLQQLFFRLFFFPMSAVLRFVVKVDNKHLCIGCFSAVVNHLGK